MSEATTLEDELQRLFEQHLRKKKADGTADQRLSHFKQFRQWLAADEDRPKLLDVSQYNVEDHFDTIRNTHPDTTATARLDAISAFYSWLRNDTERLADEHGITVDIEENPARGILEEYENINFTPKKAQIYDHDIVALTREEAEKLVARENVPEPVTRNQLLLKLLLQTGVRASEAREIRVDDIDRDERRIRVEDAKDHGTRRSVYYQPSLDSLLGRWLDGGLRATYANADNSPYLFVTSRSDTISYTAIRETVHKAADNAGIQDKMYVDASGSPRWKVSPHTLRHTWARFAVTGDNRMDISRAAVLMGHRDQQGNPNIETTKKYLAFREEDLRDASQACIPDI